MRVSADPVRMLMHRHRELCERAVDPLEIAAWLEARGVTDRTAARFRHRDVFSLAEELYARVPRAEPHPPAAPPPAGRPGAAARLRALPGVLLPAVLCGATLGALALLPAAAPLAVRLTVAVLGASAALAVLRLTVCRRTPPGAAGLPAVLLIGYAVAGEAVLGELTARPPAGADGAGAAAATAALTLALAVAPAVWSVRWFGRRAAARLTDSRGLREFAAAVRPLLATAVLLFALALPLCQALAWALLQPLRDGRGAGPPEPVRLLATGAVALLLYTALLLIAHRHRTAAAAGLAAAVGGLLLTLSAASASWLPGLRSLGAPVDALVALGGPALPAAVVCAPAAAGLLVHAARVLTGPWAHHPPAGRPTVPPPQGRPAARHVTRRTPR